jgi:gliding motility-associated-like protein
MKIKTAFLLFFSITSNLLFGQLTLKIQPPVQDPCVDSTITFYVTDDSNNELSGVDLTWDFGDGSALVSGTDLDSVEHTFTEGGGHIIRVDGTDGVNSDYVLFQYETALTPNFHGTNSSKDDSICILEEILLKGVINDSTWVYEIPDKSEEENPLKIPESGDYVAKYDYRIFEETEFITDGSEIDTIMVMLEHNNLADVQVELICPNGSGIILKSFGGQDGIDLGIPNASNPNTEGTAYTYYWTDFGTNTAMNDITIALPDTIMPEGEYGSESNFNSLAGCPLNGEWKIKVTGDVTDSQGWVFASQLTLDGQQIFTDWEYSHTYNQFEWVGETGHVGSINLSDTTSIAYPDLHGNIRYYFKSVDNFGCRQDTSLIVRIEAPTFTFSPDSVPFNDTISFIDKTSWATEYEWDFGDDSPFSTEKEPIHTYSSDGQYKVILTARTPDGCEDTVSDIVTLIVPDYDLEQIPNAFNPNSTGNNNTFNLKGNGLDGLKSFECYIYSRWGKKVAEWHSIEEAKNGWDGRIMGGRDASPGVYYYVIKAIGYDGSAKEKKGFVHLFR